MAKALAVSCAGSDIRAVVPHWAMGFECSVRVRPSWQPASWSTAGAWNRHRSVILLVGDRPGFQPAAAGPGSGLMLGPDALQSTVMARDKAVQRLSRAANALPASERAAFLDAECAGDADLRLQVERGLASSEPTLTRTAQPPVVIGAETDEAPHQFVAAQKIGRFAVLSKLGAGGMGEVYAAYDDHLDRKVAIKVLRARRDHDRGRARFVREARAMAQLSHPNVASVYEVSTFDDQVFIAMEFIDGSTLREWCQGAERTPWQILDMYLQAGRGLAAAHAAGLIHRDFKPANVLVGRDGRPRVLDFGLARSSEDAREPTDERSLEQTTDRDAADSSGIASASSWSDTLTADGAVMGTPHFMSPEQLRGEPVDAASDQYNFCVALYADFVGCEPFPVDNLRSIARAKAAGRLQTRSDLDVSLQPVREILARGLEPEPERRWGSMDELLEQLSRQLEAHMQPALRFSRRQAVAFFGVFCGALMVVSTIIGVNVRDIEELSPAQFLYVGIGYLVFAMLLLMAIWRWMSAGAVLRKLVQLFVITFVMLLLNRALGVVMDLPVARIVVADLLLFATATAVGALTLTPVLWWMVPYAVLLASVAAFVPAASAWCMSLAPVAIPILALAIWLQGRRATRRPPGGQPSP